MSLYLECLAAALTPINVVIAFIGTMAGIIFGALPGFTPSMGIAILIPFTYKMNVTPALILLGALYCGAFYGGSISAILVNTPGTPGAAATALDGFPMTQQGKAREALSEAGIASFWGGIISLTVLFFVAAPLARFALKFGVNENFLLAILGLSIIGSLSKENMLKNLLGGMLGIMLACVGSDPMTGVTRYTFGIPELLTGIQLVPALIGLYSIPQIVSMATSKENAVVNKDAIRERGSRFKLKEMVGYPIDYIRSAFIGIIIGIIPGPGGNTASWLAYSQAKAYSRTPEKFGKGCRQGIANTEAANNGVTGGSMIPMLALGIPGNAVAAVLLSALMIKGLAPGYTMFTTNADITYTFVFGLVLANIMMLLIALLAAKYVAVVAFVPQNILGACVAVLCIVGSFAVSNSMMNIYIMLAMGALGLLLKKLNFDSTPIVLGMILGPMAEANFGRSILLNKTLSGMFADMLTRPISVVLLAAIIITLAMPWLQETLRSRKTAKANEKTEENKSRE